MSKHLALTCHACGYEDFEWSEEQDEHVAKEEVMIKFTAFVVDYSVCANLLILSDRAKPHSKILLVFLLAHT